MDQVLDIAQLIRLKREEILQVAAKHGAQNVRVFGSVARGDAKPDSDVDFLIDVGAVTSSWFPGGLIVDLEALLGKRVEVVTERALHPLLRDKILREAVPI
jgi:predicted nucleotidyltransferase